MAGAAALTARLVDMSSLSKSAMNTKRRRFRFSLRTMFVLVVVLCLPFGWLDWNRRIVRERESARVWLKKRLGDVSELPAVYTCVPGPQTERNYSDSLEPTWLRTMLGDRIVYGLEFPPTLSESERLWLLNLFPEAKVVQWSPEAWAQVGPLLMERRDQEAE